MVPPLPQAHGSDGGAVRRRGSYSSHRLHLASRQAHPEGAAAHHQVTHWLCCYLADSLLRARHIKRAHARCICKEVPMPAVQKESYRQKRSHMVGTIMQSDKVLFAIHTGWRR